MHSLNLSLHFILENIVEFCGDLKHLGKIKVIMWLSVLQDSVCNASEPCFFGTSASNLRLWCKWERQKKPLNSKHKGALDSVEPDSEGQNWTHYTPSCSNMPVCELWAGISTMSKHEIGSAIFHTVKTLLTVAFGFRWSCQWVGFIKVMGRKEL